MSSRLLERRTVNGEVESRAKGQNIYVEGYASVFEKRSGNLGGFVEKVNNTAFNKTIKEADVRALWNHDPQYLLGRTSSKTLELSIDSSGLYYRSLLPNTTYAKNLAELLERRDVRESSFTFFKVEDKWELTTEDREGIPSGYPLRSLVEVGLIDIAPVTFPAYNDATSGVARRAALDGLAKRCGVNGCDIEVKFSEDEAIKEAIQKLIEPDDSTKDEPQTSTRSNSPEADNSTQQNSKIIIPRDKEELRRLIEETEAIVNERFFQ